MLKLVLCSHDSPTLKMRYSFACKLIPLRWGPPLSSLKHSPLIVSLPLNVVFLDEAVDEASGKGRGVGTMSMICTRKCMLQAGISHFIIDFNFKGFILNHFRCILRICPLLFWYLHAKADRHFEAGNLFKFEDGCCTELALLSYLTSGHQMWEIFFNNIWFPV